jgi:transposase InsO family protein
MKWARGKRPFRAHRPNISAGEQNRCAAERKRICSTPGNPTRFNSIERQASAVAANVLDRAFEAAAPNREWIADFTYVWTAEGWIYEGPSSTCSLGA